MNSIGEIGDHLHVVLDPDHRNAELMFGAQDEPLGKAMRRRDFIKVIGGTAVTWPLTARAQQPALPVIGFLYSRGPNDDPHFVRAFKQGLSESGYVEGRNVVIEYRWAEGVISRLPSLAADLVSRRVTVITATGGGADSALAAKAATSSIPIVFTSGPDPVKIGLVASLNRPGGNLTGMTSLGVELGPKRLELARELVPIATNIAFLVNPKNPNAAGDAAEMQAASRGGKQTIHVLKASTEAELDLVFASLREIHADVLLVAVDPYLISRRKQIVALSTRYAIPAVYYLREFVVDGGLISYGASISDQYRQIGIYTAKILNGARPSDLPVQQPTKFELVINNKTAKALGLSVPPTLLARADEVIE